VTHSSTSSLATGRRLRAGLALSGAALALIALAGCAPAGDSASSATPTPSVSATPTPTASATSTAEPTESAPPAPVAEGTAVDKTCDSILTADDVYALNPNYSVDPGYAPSSDTAVTATTYNGVSCGWINQSSGEVIEVSLALPNETLTNALKDAALANGDIVPTYGTAPEVEGYFSQSASTAQVFTNGYWVAVASPGMVEPGDAERIVGTVLGNL
jgi:hypothetical protein